MFYAEEHQRETDENDDLDPMIPRIQVRPFNLKNVKQMRDLEPLGTPFYYLLLTLCFKDIDKLISIRGMIIRTSSIIPELEEGFFSCIVCQATSIVPKRNDKVDEPKTCANCKAKGSVSIIHNRCTFTDKQWIKLQETPDAIPECETPHTVSLYCYEDLVDVARPGDRVEISGIYRAVPVRNVSIHRTVKSIYRTCTPYTIFLLTM